MRNSTWFAYIYIYALKDGGYWTPLSSYTLSWINLLEGVREERGMLDRQNFGRTQRWKKGKWPQAKSLVGSLWTNQDFIRNMTKNLKHSLMEWSTAWVGAFKYFHMFTLIWGKITYTWRIFLFVGPPWTSCKHMNHSNRHHTVGPVDHQQGAREIWEDKLTNLCHPCF